MLSARSARPTASGEVSLGEPSVQPSHDPKKWSRSSTTTPSGAARRPAATAVLPEPGAPLSVAGRVFHELDPRRVSRLLATATLTQDCSDIDLRHGRLAARAAVAWCAFILETLEEQGEHNSSLA